jgi:hypothetical protein
MRAPITSRPAFLPAVWFSSGSSDAFSAGDQHSRRLLVHSDTPYFINEEEYYQIIHKHFAEHTHMFVRRTQNKLMVAKQIKGFRNPVKLSPDLYK